jgi:hypothetical protein
MAINMQGSWTVSVKSVEAFEPAQRFVVSGAASGNGTYVAAATTPPVHVTGDHWSISVQMNRGSGFVEIADQITFPVVTSGEYHFDIQANSPPNDPVFDDVILTCSTPVTLEDYIIYGNVSYYSDSCIFNPCFLPFLVIDTPAALAAALRNPTLKVPIQMLYPDRVALRIPPIPLPDPPPFSPLVIPLREQTAIPSQVGQVFTVARKTTQSAKAKAAAPADAAPAATSAKSLTLSQATLKTVDFDRVAVSGIVDHLFRFCQTGVLPGASLRFQEYDRTNAELAGGSYTGTGSRENLGVGATDRNGNYIFRFSRTLAQYIHEAQVDVAPGEDVFTQILPDVIVTLLDYMRAGGYCYESAPYWNIPFLKQINVCVPSSCVGRIPTACQGHSAIQGIGNINIGDVKAGYVAPPGSPPGYGPRVGFSNSLGEEGRITAKDTTTTDVPQARCAAWFSSLDFYACFLDHPEVAYYTMRWRKHLPLYQSWNFFTEEYRHPKPANEGTPGYHGDLVGPQLGVSLHIDGGGAVLAPAYLNIENDPNWRLKDRDRKAVITSTIYAPAGAPGPIDLRIEGYDSSGHKVAQADDTITLYIDNSNPDYWIDSVTMADPVSHTTEVGGVCALFNLHGEANTPLTVRFKANQFERFLNRYDLGVRKGNSGGFAIDDNGPGLLSAAYVHTDDLSCNSLEGTFDDPTHDGSGFVFADIVATNGHWLDPGQPFCTFAIQLSCSVRVTNGYNQAVYGYGPTEYLLGIQAT